MPDRIVREGLLTSERYVDCSCEAQMLFVHLLLACDDWGCYDGRPWVIAAKCYPKKVEVESVAKLLLELHEHDLVQRYLNAGKLYLAINRWYEGLRGPRKYPAPPISNELEQPPRIRGKYGRQISADSPRSAAPQSSALQPADADGMQLLPAITTEDPQSLQPQQAITAGSHCGQSLPAITSNRSATQSLQAVIAGNLRLSTSSPPPLASESRARAREPPTTTTATLKDLQKEGSERLNGEEVAFDGVKFVGISEAQELRWQAAFPGLAVLDQVDRAAVWLASRPEQWPKAGGDTAHAFLARWLLRESRPQAVIPPSSEAVDYKGEKHGH